ncbi:MAG TPA: branched-chain amino acid ABC transporter permease [Pirellulales bacterium]|jgi:branched-chain amino acid transport system permease protein|nr:branched-chain amino acid ABC transporter permease [Pirellulales bacterium]
MNPSQKPPTRFLKRWDVLVLAVFVFYPFACSLTRTVFPSWAGPTFGNALGDQLSTLFIFSILALGLNVAVGYTGLLQLGIAAFFGIGVYITGILRVPSYPFQLPFTAALVLSALGAALCGLVLGAPTLRLRGDYLALVTLGFGEVVKVTLRNLEEITAGTKGLNPIPPPHLPPWLAVPIGWLGIENSWETDYRLFYFLTLGILVIVIALLANLENSRLGRSWVAIREDELAATCMGINAPRAKLASFAASAGLAGLAGCLYATKLTTTADPNTYDFNRSIIILCCVILGGLGSLRGVLLGVLLLLGFDNIVSPQINSTLQSWLQHLGGGVQSSAVAERLLSFSNWRLMIFGLALVAIMRFRPEGLWPSARLQHELHWDEPRPPLPNSNSA